MITITKDANVYTMIVHFEIEPAHQQEQINAIVEFVESVVKHQHAKPDGHDYEVYHVTDCPEG